MPAVIAKFDSRAAKFFVPASFILATIGNQIAAGTYPFSNVSTVGLSNAHEPHTDRMMTGYNRDVTEIHQHIPSDYFHFHLLHHFYTLEYHQEC
jgi:hypothetical protein